MKNILQEMKDIDIIEPIITIQATLKEQNIKEMEELVDKIGGE